MVRNYLKIALRKLRSNLLFSLITVLCLTAGFASFILIYIHIDHQLSFDRFHENEDRIYRVLHHENEETGERITSSISPQLAIHADDRIAGIEDLTYVVGIGRITLGNELEIRDYEEVILADTNFFDFFDFDILVGDGRKALSTPNGILLTESKARKYFQGNLPQLGDSLFSNFFPAQISAVLADPPDNTHLNFGVIIPQNVAMANMSWYRDYMNSNWDDNAYHSYVRIARGTDPADIEREMTSLLKNNLPVDANQDVFITLQPLKDVHFSPAEIQGGEGYSGTNMYYLVVFGTIGLLVLVVAAFNYMNLSTAAALQRTREIGLRKTIGASRNQLITQFFTESFLLTLCSLLLSVLVADIALPYMNQLGGWQLTLPFGDPWFWLILGLTWIFTAVVSSLYPSYVIHRILPSQAVRDKIGQRFSGLNLRKTLIIVQFTVSIVMISGTILVYQQLEHLRKQDKGFEMSNRMVIDINSWFLRRDFASVKSEMKKVPSISNVSVSSRIPGEWKNLPLSRIRPEGSEMPPAESIYIAADEDFLSTFGVQLLEGKNFTGSEADSLHVLITESMVVQLGLEDPVGKRIEIPEVNWSGNVEELQPVFRAQVIGVVKDFQMESFRDGNKPTVIAFRNNPIHNIDYYTIEFTGRPEETLAEIRRINEMFDPENPVEHHYLDVEFQRFYQEDEVRGNLFLIFAVLVILIACFGLFALATFEIRRKTYEVGVRKVLGASTMQLTQMLLNEFLILILISFVIGFPLAYWMSNSWLSEFSSKINAVWIYYVAAGLITLILALLTTGILTYRAANAKPVDSLRTE